MDVSSRKDISQIVDSFYSKVHKDKEMKPIFQMPKEAWEKHLHTTLNFWDNMLFGTGSYPGGLMWVHIQKHRETPFTTHHFEKWLSYWFLSIDENFEGKNASFMKDKALQIGQIMNSKLNG